MLALIAGLPGLIALAVCIRHGTKPAFMWVYLPSLLLLPDEYRWPILGSLTFHEAAVIPIAVCFLLGSSRTWKLSMTDALLLGYCALTVVSQFYNRNVYDARNTALRDATYIVFPYILAKGLLSREDFGLKVGKQIVSLLAIVSIASVYEFKMSTNLFETLVQPFFPPSNWQPSFRYGVTRVAGPFGHALLTGIILLVGYRLTRWIEWSRCWHQQIPLLGISVVRFCQFSIAAGAAMTAARGAWTGAIIASLLALLGRSRNRIWTLTATIALILVVGPPVYWGVHAYVSPNPGQEISESQQTANYRLDLVREYLPIIEERSGLGYGQGWGQDPFPVMNGMWSIDDHYILVALTYGVYALVLWLGAYLWMLARLVRFGSERSPKDVQGMLAWTLAGACTLYGFTLTTVWLGGQSGPFLYMIWGWAEGLLLSRPLPKRATESVRAHGSIRYDRVMAGVTIPQRRLAVWTGADGIASGEHEPGLRSRLKAAFATGRQRY